MKEAVILTFYDFLRRSRPASYNPKDAARVAGMPAIAESAQKKALIPWDERLFDSRSCRGQ
jgi:hypothetical protein